MKRILQAKKTNSRNMKNFWLLLLPITLSNSQLLCSQSVGKIISSHLACGECGGNKHKLCHILNRVKHVWYKFCLFGDLQHNKTTTWYLDLFYGYTSDYLLHSNIVFYKFPCHLGLIFMSWSLISSSFCLTSSDLAAT